MTASPDARADAIAKRNIPHFDSWHVPARQAVRAAIREGMQGACSVPPEGWRCTRQPGHDGPCAAVAATLPATPETAYPSHDVCEEGWLISDPVCQSRRCGVGQADIFRECPGTPTRPPAPAEPNERWWAQRWVDKASAGELAAMREILTN